MSALRTGFLATRVGRRLLGNFLWAALLPVIVVAVVGFVEVRRTLLDEAEQRVSRLAKSGAVTLLGALAAEQRDTSAAARGALPALAPLTPEAVQHLRGGSPLLVVHARRGAERDPVIELLRLAPDGTPRRHALDAARLWSALAEVVEGDRSAYCVFAGSAFTRVRCSDAVLPGLENRLRAVARERRTRSGTIIDDEHVFGQRQLFLRFEYGADEWHLVTAEATGDVLAPLWRLTTVLALLVVLAAAIAFTLGHRQIRHSTQPLVQLHAATARVSAGDLETPVQLTSDDEYGALGDAFNGMTATLARQLRLLRGLDGIDEAALHERERTAIAEAALAHLVATRSVRQASVALVEPERPDRLQLVTIDREAPRTRRSAGRLAFAEREALFGAPRVLRLGTGAVPGYVPPALAADGAAGELVVFPLVHDEALVGALTVRFDGDTRTDAATAPHIADARRVADRITLGVANTIYVERLDALSMGAIRAFANAIDANSPWTAGHSERVTATAVLLGRRLGCSAGELAMLQRGGLLHDIGKIGIPAAILNKPGPLTPEERAIIERHPVIGEQILAPLPVFTSVLPIVRSHHERFDGTGYPDRLRGEEIPWLARIMAVADVHDALSSHRPYRAGLPLERVLGIMTIDAGTAFDPRVVDALHALAGEGALAPVAAAATSTSTEGATRDASLVPA
ncbi:MAG: HD domain-containing protein [Gemmatimonadaceae bacterium]|nr:HD domain-containing protein [Gemmatimonadaceae bacterium]